MKLDEINERAWMVSPKLIVDKWKHGGVSGVEQECIFNCDKHNDTIHVSCSYEVYITKLSKSEFFYLERVLVSDHVKNKGTIVQVDGYIEPKGLTIRAKKPVFDESERIKRSEMMKERFKKRNL